MGSVMSQDEVDALLKGVETDEVNEDQKQKIARPRQLFTGPNKRKFKPISERH